MIDYAREDVIEALEYLLSPVCTETQFDYCDEIRAAIALLRDQEARVMTLEEARETMQTADFMYCEDKNDDTMAGGLVLGMRTDVFWDLANGEYMDFDDLGYFGKLAGEYGKSFRFWTSRPSPEQMRATKWEGENETM